MAVTPVLVPPNPPDDSWKERLGLISGNILVAGVALLSLWPAVASYPTGIHTHAWTLFMRYARIRPEFVAYRYLLMALTTALTSVVLAALHIFCRGLRLATDFASDTLEAICTWTFRSVFVLLFYFLVLTAFEVVNLSALAISQVLTRHHHTGFWAEVVAQGPAGIILFLAAFKGTQWLKRQIGKSSKSFDEVLSAVASIGAAIFLFLFITLIAIETCYTVDVSVNKQFFQQTSTAPIEITVRLGGATSDPSLAKLSLDAADGKLLQDLSMQDQGDGRYGSFIPGKSLVAGNYRIVLQYPHSGISREFPFLHSTTQRSVGLLVVP